MLSRIGYYTSNDRNDLTSFDLLWIYCTTCYCRSAADDEISTDITRRTVSRSPSAVAELFVPVVAVTVFDVEDFP